MASKFSYSIADEPIVVSKTTLDILLKGTKPADLIALYVFYYYTAKWQKSDKAKATTSFTAIGLMWSEDRVRRIKKELITLGLVKDVKERGKNNAIQGHFVKVHFFWSMSHPPGKPECGSTQTVGKSEGNALSTNNKKEKKTNNKKNTSAAGGRVTPTSFEKFWKRYPRKDSKGAAKVAWNKVCKLPTKDKPSWQQLKKAVKTQKFSPRWNQDKKFIPLCSTWLNQFRWLDDPKGMTIPDFKKEDTNGKKPANGYMDDDYIKELEQYAK